MLLRAVTYLAPIMQPVYQAIVDHVGRQLGCQTELVVGASDYSDAESADLAFICGLPYVRRAHWLEAIAAPVLIGGRYHNQPIYFSDVIVRQNSPFQCFADLRGRSWAYNEPESQSGYGITRYHLLKLGETRGYFGSVIRAGYHQAALRMVCTRKVDATAIDSHVLALILRDHPKIEAGLRVIEVLGPSTIQPIAAARRLPASLKGELQQVLTTLHHNPSLKTQLERGLIDHLSAVDDAAYDDIRAMEVACHAAGLRQLR